MAGERKLVVKIVGDATGLGSTLDGAAGSVSGWGGKLKGALTSVAEGGGAFSGLANGALGIGETLGKIPTPVTMIGASLVAGGAAALKFGTDFADSAENAAKETSKLQRLTGGTAEDMSRLRFVAQQTGMDADTLGAAFVKLSTKGLGGSADKLKELGISFDDANGKARPMKDVLTDIAGKFGDMQGGAEKNKLAVDLFGKSGADLLPILNRGSDGIGELMEKADKFGFTIGQGTVDDMKKHVAAQRDMSAAWEGAKIQIGEKLMPIVTKLSTWFAEHLPAAIEWAKAKWAEFGPSIMDALGKVWGFLQDIGARIAAFWHDHGESIVGAVKLYWGIITTIIGVAFEVISTVVGKAVAIGEWMGRAINEFWQQHGQEIIRTITDTWAWIMGIFNNAKDAVMAFIELVKDLWHGKWGEVWDDIKKLFSSAWDGLVSLVSGVGERMWSAAKGIGRKIWDGIVDGITGAADAVGNIASTIWTAIKGFINSKLIDPVRGFSVDIPVVGTIHPFGAFPRLTLGGTVQSGGWATVGETGQENVWLPAGASVVPLNRGDVGGGGSTVIHNHYVTIQAGVTGDPVEIGRNIDEYLSQFERVNGSRRMASAA